MAKKPNKLAAALEGATAEREAPAAPRPSKKVPAKADKGDGKTVLIGGHFDPAVARQLAIISAEEGTNKRELMMEAFNMLFKKKGKEVLTP